MPSVIGLRAAIVAGTASAGAAGGAGAAAPEGAPLEQAAAVAPTPAAADHLTNERLFMRIAWPPPS